MHTDTEMPGPPPIVVAGILLETIGLSQLPKRSDQTRPKPKVVEEIDLKIPTRLKYSGGEMIVRALILLIPFLFSENYAEARTSSWQGIFYPNGCLTCDDEYVHSPVFKSFKECKRWAEKKMKNNEDKASCGRNCEYQGKIDMSKCDEVVRSWFIPILPDASTFKTYKE